MTLLINPHIHIKMKRILVPTDFSENALQALDYASKIANRFGGHITLLSTFETPRPTGSLRSMRNIIYKDREEQMTALVSTAHEKLVKGTTIEGRVVEGRTIDLIVKAAKYYNADLIVMGTKGASGLKEIFMGSKTSGVIQKTEIPVLAVPANCNYRPFGNIVLAIDALKFSNEKVLTPLLAIAERYKAEIKVFHLERALVPAGFDAKVLSFLEGVPYDFTQSTEYDNINESINDFVKASNADMLCMIRRARGKLQELFHSSVTRKEVFNSPVPLLVLQDK